MKTPEQQELLDLKLSAMRALVGNATSNLAAVVGAVQDFKIRFSMYYFGEPTEQDIESVEGASRLVVGDYLSPFIIDTNYGLLSDLRREELNLRDLVYLRAEAENKLLRGDLDAFY